ncbi:MAG: DUF3228 family protein [Flavobacteriaceae bacterium]
MDTQVLTSGKLNFQVGVTEFALSRHWDASKNYSQCSIRPEDLCGLIKVALDSGEGRTGYRDGVVLVSLPGYGFTTPLIDLVDGDSLVGSYVSRREGEEPRKQVHVIRDGCTQSNANSVEIVLYSSVVLAEGSDNMLPPESGNFEIVSINASLCEVGVEEPMPPETLMANHFGETGGTFTKMSDSEFVDALRRSRDFWRSRAILASN